MSDLLDGCRTKIERAKKHLHDLEVEKKAFVDDQPYVVRTKRKPDTRELIYYLVSVHEPPLVLAAIAGDVLQNLRSALDHLAYQLVSVGTHGKGPFDHVYFPIFGDAAKYNAGKHGRVKGMRGDAINAIDGIKPYKGGDDTLWRLHRLCNVDKHRLLITVGSAFKSMNVARQIERQMRERLAAHPDFGHLAPKLVLPPLFIQPADRLFPLKQGAELFIDAPDAEEVENMEFRFDIAFGEPGVVEGDPLVETLQQMVVHVDKLLPTFVDLLIP